MAGRPPVYQEPIGVATPTAMQLHCDLYEDAVEEARITQDKDLIWVVRGSLLQIFKRRTGECVSSWRARPKGARIVHVCELVFESGQFYLLLSIQNGRQFTVVMLSSFTGCVLQAIAIPSEVTSIHPVSASRLNTPGLFAHSILSRFSGIVAVGCRGGHTYLVDLRLGDESSHRTSLAHPSPLCLLNPWGDGGQCLAKAAEAMETGAHICIELSANCHRGRKFAYPSVDIPVESVAVTALHYAPQLCCLLVGYSFGSFQLYSLPQLSPVHSSPVLPNSPPVTHFTLQEANNDPQSYCYLWVAHGPRPPVDNPNREVKVTFYQLNFSRKAHGSGRYGVLYQNLHGCGPRFQYALTATPSHPNPRTSTSSRLLRCYTLERRRSKQGLDESHDGSHDEPVSKIDQTLVVFIWSSLGRDGPHYFLGVFDIDQWYQAQMPRGLQWKMSGRHTGVLGCSYFAFFSLNRCLQPGGADKPLLDAVVGGVTPFPSLPPVPETHMWPSSLDIDLYGVTDDSIVQCSYYGLQRTAIHELWGAGPAGLVAPQRLFSLCESADLLLPAWDHGSEQSDTRFQCKALLSVALEHDLMSLLLRCSKAWLDAGSDDDLALLAEWVGQKMGELMDEKHRLCYPLFAGSAHLDTPTFVYFQRTIALLHHLSKLLHSILLPLSQLGTEQAVSATFQELLAHYNNAVMSCRLLEAIEWCMKSGLLPLSRAGFTYPSTALARLYDLLRSRQQSCKLAIDHVVEELQGADDFVYPTLGFEDFLAVFTTPNTLAQHCVMIYFLCDIAALEEGKGRFQKLVHDYSAVFRVPPALRSLARGLWALDHRKFEEALKLMTSHQPGSMQWFPWQHSVVVTAMLQGDEPKLALHYSHLYSQFMVSLPDVKLKVSVLVNAKCIPAALDIVRPFQNSEDSVDVYTHFLDCCFQTKQLNKLVTLPLDSYEEDFLCGYLEDHPCLKAQELLVAFYLQCNCVREARQMHEKIKPVAMADPDPKVKERSQFRDNLVAGYERCLPPILRDINLHIQSLQACSGPVTQRSVAEHPAPLSKVQARGAAKDPTSQATVFRTIIENIVAARNVPAEPVTPFRKSGDTASGTSGLRHTPFLSTPISVKKTRAMRRQSPVVIPTPVSQQPSLGLNRVPESSMISDFRTVMQNFMTRITQSGNSSGLDTSFVRTPFAKTPPSFRKPATSLTTRLVATPPSILKVRRPIAVALEEEEKETAPTQPAEGGGANSAPRRIRFAVEGTPLISPGSRSTSEQRSRRIAGRVLTPHVPAVPSSHASSTQVAVATPLPSSDDSDDWTSPVESPSQLRISPELTPAQPSQLSPLHPDPKVQLFIEDDSQPEEAVAEVEAMSEDEPEGEEKGDGREEKGNEGEEKKDGGERKEEGGEEKEDRGEKKEEGESGDTEIEKPADNDRPEPPADTPKSSLSQKRALKMISVTLQRQSIGSSASGWSPAPTPHTQPPPTTIHARPSPLVTHVQAASPLSLTGSTTPGTLAVSSKPGLATPVLVSDLVAAKKKQLHSIFEEARKRDVSLLKTSSPIAGSSPAANVQPSVAKVHVVKDQLSATMVTQLRESYTKPEVAPEIAVTSSATITQTLGTQFGFSPPMSLSPSPPPVQEATDQTPAFVFSPPLTRSAAKRQTEKSVESTTTNQTKKGSRSRRSVHPPPSFEPVSLVTPPTSPPAAVDKGRHTRRKPKPIKSSVGTRRSTRLLRDRK